MGLRGVRLGFAALGVGTLLAAAPTAAQNVPAGGGLERADDSLSRNLRLLAQNPKSLQSLMGAGRAALELGDPQAALTFFARAEEQAPRDGRIKMWIGSALVQLQQPRTAMKFFGDALSMGVADADVARDRGLAHDLSGNGVAAQRDYRLALTKGRDDEVTRRLALSLAIGGQREPALKLLEPQLLARDRAADRTRALVLALTGDTSGAVRVASAGMSGPQANAMTPFLTRLPTLSAADRALAVHLGVFPGDGRTTTTTYAANSARLPAAVTDAGRPDPAKESLARRIPPTQTVTRPVTTVGKAETPASTKPAPEKAVPAQSSRSTSAPVTRSEPARTEPAAAQPLVAKLEPSFSIVPSPPAQRPQAEPVATASVEPQPSAPPPQAEEQPAGSSRLADLAAVVATIPDAAAPVRAVTPKPKPVKATPPPAAAKKNAAAAAPAKKKVEAPAEPSRHWVQIAGGADKGGLPREFARLKAKAPKVFGARPGWTTPLNATNRLLVGPFASAKEAQEFVNNLKAQDLSAFAWTSAAGQKIEKLPAK